MWSSRTVECSLQGSDAQQLAWWLVTGAAVYCDGRLDESEYTWSQTMVRTSFSAIQMFGEGATRMVQESPRSILYEFGKTVQPDIIW